MRQTLQSRFVLLPYMCKGLECQKSRAKEDTSVFAKVPASGASERITPADGHILKLHEGGAACQ